METEDHEYCAACGAEIAYRYRDLCSDCAAAEEREVCEWYRERLHAFLHTVNARHLLDETG